MRFCFNAVQGPIAAVHLVPWPQPQVGREAKLQLHFHAHTEHIPMAVCSRTMHLASALLGLPTALLKDVFLASMQLHARLKWPCPAHHPASQHFRAAPPLTLPPELPTQTPVSSRKKSSSKLPTCHRPLLALAACCAAARTAAAVARQASPPPPAAASGPGPYPSLRGWRRGPLPESSQPGRASSAW